MLFNNNNTYARILAISDIHFGATKHDEHLYQELEEVFISYINENKDSIDLIIICGDTADREVGMNEKAGRLMSKFILTINNISLEHGIPFFIFKGTMSHDFNQLENFRKLELLNPNFKIFNTVTKEKLDIGCEEPLKLLIIPEEYVENPDEYYNEYFDEMYDFIFVHGTFDFAGYVAKLSTSEKSIKGAPTFNSKQFSEMAYGCTIAGHVHTSMNDNNVFYCGSFSRFSFGEEEDKGFFDILYNIEDSEDLELTFVVNELAPTYVTIQFDDLPNDIEEKSKYIKKLKESYDYIRIKSKNGIDDETDLQVLKEFSSNDSSIKMEVTKRQETKEDHKFDFILERKLDMPETIQKFQLVKFGRDVNLEKIKKVINYVSTS